MKICIQNFQKIFKKATRVDTREERRRKFDSVESRRFRDSEVVCASEGVSVGRVKI